MKDSRVYACSNEIRIQGSLCRIARLDADGYKYLDDPAATLDELARSGKRIDLFTFIQRPSEGTQSKYEYPMEWDNLAVLPVSTFDDWWNKKIGFKARNKAKQAQKKGVMIKEVQFDDDLVRGIWEIYNETPVRQGRAFHHYGKDIEAVRRLSATYLDSSIFIGAYCEQKLIGFIKLTMDDERVHAGMMHIVSMISHRDKAPTNALVAQAVRSCADRGITNLVYSNFGYGNKVRSSLSDFKERNGFQRVDLPRYYVPLTAMGRIALRLGLHRRFIERVPESIAGTFRDLRKGWYDRRYGIPTES
jgi:hypothetical protein